MENKLSDSNIAKKPSKNGAVIGFGIIFAICIIYALSSFFGASSDNSKLENYLKKNNYTKSGECWTKDITDNNSTKTVKYCLSECKYYSEDSTMNDKFVLNISTLDIDYQYSYMTYKYKSSSSTTTCLSNSREVATGDYACKLASSLATKHLKLFNDVIIDELNVQPKHICK